MTDFINALIQDGMVIAVCSFVVCQIVKTSFDFINNKYIPLIGGLAGALLGVAIPAVFPDASIIEAAIKGLVIGWASTGAFETFKNLKA